jgi:hypothetical protein
MGFFRGSTGVICWLGCYNKSMVSSAVEMNINLSAIVYQEDGAWLAHCLELDIVAEGSDAGDAIKSLVSLCDLQIRTAIEDGDVASIFRPAPPEIWKLFASGRQTVVEQRGRRHRTNGFKSPVSRFETRKLCLV